MVASSTTQGELQRIWRLVQELSAQLKENQLETEHLRRQAQYLQIPDEDVQDAPEDAGNAPDEGRQSNGHAKSQNASSDQDAAMLQQLDAYREENRLLKQENEEMSFLLAEYELGLEAAMDRIRIHEHAVALERVALKRQHQAALDIEREATTEARGRHAVLQQELQRIQVLIRQAYAADTAAEPDVLIETLQIENAALRDALGIEE